MTREDQFADFWQAYPRRVAKGTARTAFDKAIRKTTLETMLAAIADYIRFKPERIDFKHPATWLNSEGWSDEWQSVPRETGRKRTFADVAIDRFNNGSASIYRTDADAGVVPQTSGNPDLTLSAYELAVQGLSAQSVIESAQRFISGLVEGQSMDFAPAAPRFAQEARKRQEYIDLLARPRLPFRNSVDRPTEFTEEHRTRMKFNWAVYLMGMKRDDPGSVATAWKQGQPAMVELGIRWDIPVPDGLKSPA